MVVSDKTLFLLYTGSTKNLTYEGWDPQVWYQNLHRLFVHFNLGSLFLWAETKEGYKFWRSKTNNKECLKDEALVRLALQRTFESPPFNPPRKPSVRELMICFGYLPQEVNKESFWE